MKTRINDRAIERAASPPEKEQEEIGREILTLADALGSRCGGIETGRRGIVEGKVRRHVFDDLLQELQEEYGAQE